MLDLLRQCDPSCSKVTTAAEYAPERPRISRITETQDPFKTGTTCSNPAAARCLQTLGKKDVLIVQVILAHRSLSEMNNTPEKSYGKRPRRARALL